MIITFCNLEFSPEDSSILRRESCASLLIFSGAKLSTLFYKNESSIYYFSHAGSPSSTNPEGCISKAEYFAGEFSVINRSERSENICKTIRTTSQHSVT